MGGSIAYETMEADEKKWQAECDARTLAEAEVIKADPDRFKAAKTAAKALADEQKKEAAGMEKIADINYDKMKD